MEVALVQLLPFMVAQGLKLFLSFYVFK